MKKEIVAKFEKVSYEEFYKACIKVNRFKVQEHYDSFSIPKRKTEYSAGYDFECPFDLIIKPNQTLLIPLGIRCKIEPNYYLGIYPRSSLGFKYKLKLDNTIGIIDADYYNSDNEGHIMIKITNTGDKELCLSKGDAICQGVFHRYYLAEEEMVTTKRNGGFGSTNKK